MKTELQVREPPGVERILKVAVATPVASTFDYLPPLGPGEIEPGMRLEVPFGRQRLVGVVLERAGESEVSRSRLRRAERPLDPEPLLQPADLRLLSWIAAYYHAPIGEVVAMALPPALRKPVPLPELPEEELSPELSGGVALNPEQARALEAILAGLGRFTPVLLEGVTGSGKTEVYLEAIRRVVARGEQALVLLPEIALTPKIEERFRRRFGPIVATYHSGLSPGERLKSWLRFRRGELKVLVGTRSAVLIPMARPGLIVVDEEHDPAYKQQDGVRFLARDVAIRRAQLLGIPVLLGSATPSLETLWNARRGRFAHLLLTRRAQGASLPRLLQLDLRGRRLQGGFLPESLRRIAERLERGEQVIVFHNRRGYAPTLACEACDWVATCRNCSVRLVLHKGEGRLRCHHCGAAYAVPESCPKCRAGTLPLGKGTERVEQFLKEHFPGIRLARLDRDTARSRKRLLELLDRMERGEIDLLVGTQMLSKGHHFPGVTLVVIPDADAGLLGSDFRAPERFAQTVVQVAGRAGRGERPGEVLLQTRYPDYPMLRALLEEGYRTFAELALEERQAASLPPFSHLALVLAEARKEARAEEALLEARALLEGSPGVSLLGPAPAPIARRARFYRYQLLLQSRERPPLHRALSRLRAWLRQGSASLRLSIDVDPLELL